MILAVLLWNKTKFVKANIEDTTNGPFHEGLYIYPKMAGLSNNPKRKQEFENRDLFFPFKKYASTLRVFESFSPVHMKRQNVRTFGVIVYSAMLVVYDVFMMYDNKVFENLLSSVRVEREEPAFQEISTTGTVFENLPCWCPETPFRRRRKVNKDKKKSPFSKISEYVWTEFIVSRTEIIVLAFSCFFINQSKINVTSKRKLSNDKRTQSFKIFG